MMRRALLAIACAVALAAPCSRALAAPDNAGTAQMIPVTCTFADNTTADLVVVVNSGQSGSHGQGNPQTWGPAFIVQGGSGQFKSLAFNFVFTVLDTSTTPPTVLETFTSSDQKGNAQVNGLGPAAVCTFSQSQTQGNLTFVVDGTVSVVQNTHANA